MLLNIIKNSEMLDSQNMLNINETTNGIYILVKGINIIKNIYNILKELNKLCIYPQQASPSLYQFEQAQIQAGVVQLL